MNETSTPESIIHAAYALISGRRTEKRDWARWKTLHLPDARLIPIERTADGQSRAPRILTPDEFIASRSPLFEQQDFYEWETAREERRFGHLAQVWSSYEAAHEPHGEPIRRGVNSIQLTWDGSRWWIMSIAWDAVEAIDILAK